MAKRRNLLLGFAALLLFCALSLILTNLELSTIDAGARRTGGEPTYAEVVAGWRREDRDLLIARHNPAAAVPAPGLNVGRVLAKYDGKDEGEHGRAPAANSRAKRRGRGAGRTPDVQQNWAASLLLPPSVRDRLETLRRLKNRELRMDTATRELWFYLRDQLRAINSSKTPAGREELKAKVLHSVKEQLDLLSLHVSDAQDTVDSLISEGWRDTVVTETTKLLQKRLHRLQNPENCDEAKKLMCKISKPCGFGCQIHHVAYCFIFAYATERMLVLDSSGWRYSGEWETVFQPLSNSECKGQYLINA